MTSWETVLQVYVRDDSRVGGKEVKMRKESWDFFLLLLLFVCFFKSVTITLSPSNLRNVGIIDASYPAQLCVGFRD